ncbi:MAG: helix-turn-helix domain-containing protein [Gemmatimonadales bacterium]
MAERVLIVTADDALARVACERFAAVTGGTVLHERDGVSGLEASERARPDVVVWDGDLPDPIDDALVGRVRASGAALVVVVAAGEVTAGIRALQLGAEQFVAQPMNPDHLAAAVARAAEAGRWRLRREPYRPRSLAAAEREQIELALRHHGGNRTRAARDLGISRATLINKIKIYVLDL